MTAPNNDKRPRVAVIIPTFNRWPTVADAIESVLAQDYQAVDCVVVDDASTDRSVENIQARFGEKVHLLRNRSNQEKSFCRNRGVRESSAEFVSFLDSDDILTPNSISDRMEIFAIDPDFDGVAYGASVHEGLLEQAKPSQRAPTIASYIADIGDLRTNSFLLRRQTMLERGMYNERLTNREDIELFIRLLAQLEFRSCASVVSIYRGGATARARDNWQKIIAQGTAVTDALAANAQVHRALGEHYQALRAEEYRELLRALFRAKQFRRYQAIYKQARRAGELPWNAKAFRRYCLANFLKDSSL